MMNKKLAILGAGNLGFAMAKGLTNQGGLDKGQVLLSDTAPQRREFLSREGFEVKPGNKEAAGEADIVVMAVKPYHMNTLMEEIRGGLDAGAQVLVSCAPGIDSNHIYGTLEKTMPLVRVMPNTAMGVNASATCLSGFNVSPPQLDEVKELFSLLGEVYEIPENLMHAATAIGGCGTAFVLRFIRALTEGSVEMGFKPDLALQIVAQTVDGAAELIRVNGTHPEAEIDKVTTPAGITITGLNEMEHQGFSSAVIAGMLKSFEKLSKA